MRPAIFLFALAAAGCATPIVRQVDQYHFYVDADSASGGDIVAARRIAYSFCSRAFKPVLFQEAAGARLFFTCGDPPGPNLAAIPPTEEKATEWEIGHAFIVWRDCMELAEPTLDDMISDATTVASSLSSRCLSEWGAFNAASTKGWPPSVKRTSAQEGPAERLGIARDVVLMVRARARNPAAKVEPPPQPKRTPPSL